MSGVASTIPDGTPMLAIEQPAAWLIAAGRKSLIVRERATKHRGELAIRAVKPTQSTLIGMHWRVPQLVTAAGHRTIYDLPIDAVVCVVEITDCEQVPPPRGNRPWYAALGEQLDLDDFGRGGFLWRLRLVKSLDQPIPCSPPARQVAQPTRSRGPRTGSDATRHAADSISPHSNYLRSRVLDAIGECGASGATAEEIHQATGIRLATVTARINELWSQFAAITDSGERRPTSSGRAATVWVAFSPTDTSMPASVASTQQSLF